MTAFHVLGKQQEETVVSKELWLLPWVYTELLPQLLLSLTLFCQFYLPHSCCDIMKMCPSISCEPYEAKSHIFLSLTWGEVWFQQHGRYGKQGNMLNIT